MKTEPSRSKVFYGVIRDTIRDFAHGDFISQGAALSYYTFFAIAPLFIIVLAVAGLWFGETAARKDLFGQLNQLVGQAGGDAIQSLVAAANQPRTGWWAACIAVGTLLVASTTVFVQLQDSLNRIWNVRYKPGRGLRNFIRHRLLSFAMVVGSSFLLLVSLVVSAGLSAFGNYIDGLVSRQSLLLAAVNFVVSLGINLTLFAMIFKWLPDVKIAWRDVWPGAFLTAVLFNLGKFLFGLYIGRSTFASVYGAVGSLVVILLWIYYSAQILFFGAQFTCVYARTMGVKPQPVGGANLSPPQKTWFRDRPR